MNARGSTCKKLKMVG